MVGCTKFLICIYLAFYFNKTLSELSSQVVYKSQTDIHLQNMTEMSAIIEGIEISGPSFLCLESAGIFLKSKQKGKIKFLALV